MYAGGMYIQAARFARYSVDERWHVPHFEKSVLQALPRKRVVGLAGHTIPRTARARTLDYASRMSASTAVYSSLRTRSEGVEGKFSWDAARDRGLPPSNASGRPLRRDRGLNGKGTLLRTPRPIEYIARFGWGGSMSASATSTRARGPLRGSQRASRAPRDKVSGVERVMIRAIAFPGASDEPPGIDSAPLSSIIDRELTRPGGLA